MKGWKKLGIKVFLFAALSNIANAAEWVELGESGSGDKYFVDSNSIKRNGDYMTAWIKINYIKPEKTTDGTFHSGLHLNSYNCKERTYANKSVVRYKNADAKGSDPVTSTISSQYIEYTDVVPDSVGETILDVLCGLKL